HVAAQGDEGARLVSQRRCGFQTALPGAAQYCEEMDHASPRLEGRAQPIRDHLRKPVAGGIVMIDQRTKTSKSRAVETVEKHNCRFSTVPTAPTAADKSAANKTTDESFTQNA